MNLFHYKLSKVKVQRLVERRRIIELIRNGERVVSYNHKEYMKVYRQRPEVKERKAAADKAYREKNKEVLKERSKVYNKTYRDKYPDRVLESASKHYEDHGDQVRLTKSLWKKNNPHQGRKDSATRRAAKLCATPESWGDDEFNDFMISEIYELAALRSATGTPFHIDHIIPLQGISVCGLHVFNNLRVITATENLKKGNKLL